MACKTCDHTMKGLLQSRDGRTAYWCWRCGTIRIRDSRSREEDEVPSWIGRTPDAVAIIKGEVSLLPVRKEVPK